MGGPLTQSTQQPIHKIGAGPGGMGGKGIPGRGHSMCKGTEVGKRVEGPFSASK